MPAHEKANPVQASQLGFEAVVFLTRYLAHLIKRAPGRGKTCDGVHKIKTMHKNTASTLKSKVSSSDEGSREDNCAPSLQLTWSNKLGFQNIRRSTSR
jgi:hypothetical protein